VSRGDDERREHADRSARSVADVIVISCVID
jgi:hypothetical protein